MTILMQICKFASMLMSFEWVGQIIIEMSKMRDKNGDGALIYLLSSGKCEHFDFDQHNFKLLYETEHNQMGLSGTTPLMTVCKYCPFLLDIDIWFTKDILS